MLAEQKKKVYSNTTQILSYATHDAGIIYDFNRLV